MSAALRPAVRSRSGKYLISIQASEGHYCTPRVDGLPLEEYIHVEVGIYKRRGGKWVRPSRFAGNYNKADAAFLRQLDADWTSIYTGSFVRTADALRLLRILTQDEVA